ncbi:ABC transporter ATP-binding protein [Ornithinimicrobium sp. W1665]
MLGVEGLEAGYGPVRVLHGVDLTVRRGEVVAVLGANGAGKSTLLQALVGMVQPRAGTVTLLGQPVQGRPPEDIVRRGLTLVPEGRRVFPRLTVADNLRMGGYSRSDRTAMAEDIDEMFDRFPVLGERRSQHAGTLSGGEQQQLAICRALMSRPEIILLDEPSLGLAPVMAQQVFELVAELHARDGLTVVLVEQNISQALELADHAYVLSGGRFTTSGTSAQIAAAAHDLEASYLGGQSA